jgi:hypothetical protein
MASPSQYRYTLEELARILAKDAQVAPGRWRVGVEFNVTVGQMGQSPKDAKPATLIQVGAITLSRVEENSPEVQSDDTILVGASAD